MNINSNNFIVYFKCDITVKLSPWFCGWIESMFYVYLPFILGQFVTSELFYCDFLILFLKLLHISSTFSGSLFFKASQISSTVRTLLLLKPCSLRISSTLCALLFLKSFHICCTASALIFKIFYIALVLSIIYYI